MEYSAILENIAHPLYPPEANDHPYYNDAATPTLPTDIDHSKEDVKFMPSEHLPTLHSEANTLNGHMISDYNTKLIIKQEVMDLQDMEEESELQEEASDITNDESQELEIPSSCSARDDLESPRRKSDGNQHVCIQCDQSFRSKSNLTEHVKCKHEKSLANAEACDICGRIFHWHRSYVRHMKTHETSNSETIATPRRARRQAAKSPLPAFEDGEDDEDYEPTRKDLQCQYCGKLFTKPFRMKEHVASMHEKKKGEKCEVCGKVFFWKRSFIRHMATHEKSAALEAGVEPGLVEDEDDVRKYGNDYKCPICSKIFNKTEFMKLHLKNVHGAFKDDFRCKKCDKTYSCSSSFKRHMATHEERRTIPCPMCDKEFLTKRSLSFHMDTHTGDTKFECLKCGRRFGWKSSKRSHEQTCNGTYFGSCKFCALVFGSYDMQQHHIETAHKNGWHMCVHCKLVLPSTKVLRKHACECSANMFECNICQEPFGTCGEYNHHIDIHKKAARPQDKPPQPIKIRKCMQCGRAFTKIRQLQLHRRYQHGDFKNKEYKCDQCHRSLYSFNGWKKHMSSCTGARKVEFRHRISVMQEKKIFQSSDVLANLFRGTLPYVCSICHKGFLEMRVLSLHARRHTSVEFKTLDRKLRKVKRTYYCEVCKRRFSSYMVYAKHKKSEIHQAEVAGATKDKDLEHKKQSTEESEERPFVSIKSHDTPVTVTTNRKTKNAEQLNTSGISHTSDENHFPQVVLDDLFYQVDSEVKQELIEQRSINLSSNEQLTLPLLPTETNVEHEAREPTVKVEMDDSDGYGNYDNIDDDDDTDEDLDYKPFYEEDNQESDADYVPDEEAKSSLQPDEASDVTENEAINDPVQNNSDNRPTVNREKDKVGKIKMKRKGFKKSKPKNYAMTEETESQTKRRIKDAYEVIGREGRAVKVKCKECGQIVHQGSFTVHYRMHTGELPFPCPHCGKRFRTSNTMKDHIVYRHTKATPWPCRICGKGYKDRKMRRYHERVHNDEKPYKCDQCDHRCLSTCNLRAHKLTHTGVKAFCCPVCGKCYTTKASMENHINYKHEKINTASCKFCDNMFPTRAAAYRHERRIHREHFTNQLFICEICSKDFFDKTAFIAHQYTHTGEKRFQCTLCDNKYSQKSGLDGHMAIKHGQGGYICERCGKNHVSRFQLRKHMKKHEKEDLKAAGLYVPTKRKTRKPKKKKEEVYFSNNESEDNGEADTNAYNDEVPALLDNPPSLSFSMPVPPVIYCPHCGQVFRNKQLFDKHMAEHLNMASQWQQHQHQSNVPTQGHSHYQNL